MISIYLGAKKRNQYDEFLHKIQKEKMKELWDNKEDEEWKISEKMAKKFLFSLSDEKKKIIREELIKRLR